mgnify:FL=1
MNEIYKKLLNGHQRFGTSINMVSSHKLKCDISLIKENVVLAPTMTYEFWKDFNAEITPIYSKYHSISNIKIQDIEFTFITTGVGASNLVDIVLALGVTSCKNIIFIGSVGSLEKDINIGDIVIPEFSICGDGVCKYLTGKPLKDSNTYGQKYFPNKTLYDLTVNATNKICKVENITWHVAKNFSVDTIFAQFAYIDEIKDLGSNVIEMETSALFRASEICGIRSCAIFCVSDNTVNNKSLYSGRSSLDKEKKGYSRYVVTPKIVLNLLNNLVNLDTQF